MNIQQVKCLFEGMAERRKAHGLQVLEFGNKRGMVFLPPSLVRIKSLLGVAIYP